MEMDLSVSINILMFLIKSTCSIGEVPSSPLFTVGGAADKVSLKRPFSTVGTSSNGGNKNRLRVMASETIIGDSNMQPDQVGSQFKRPKLSNDLRRAEPLATITDKQPMFFTLFSPPIDMQIKRIKEMFADKKNDYFDTHSMLEFVNLGLLGAGKFATVYKAVQRSTSKIFAIKIANQSLLEKDGSTTLKEKEIMQGLDFPFIVKLHYSFVENNKLHLVLDYASSGDLEMIAQKRTDINEYNMKVWAAQMALALQYLHTVGIIHRDMKPANVLLDENLNVKLTDFGLSKKSCDETSTSCVGSPIYMAPELLARKNYSYAIDWYAYGITLFELVGGKVRMTWDDQENRPKLDRLVVDRLSPTYANNSKFSDLISKLIDLNPARRLGGENRPFEELMKHPFFDGLDWVGVLERTIKYRTNNP